MISFLPKQLFSVLLDCRKVAYKSDFKRTFVPPPQEPVTDSTTPSSSLPNTVATNNAKMEDTLVNNVSNQSEI